MPTDNNAPSPLWAAQGAYPSRQGNGLEIFIDGQAAYREIATSFYCARTFIYSTISFGAQDFLLVPETGEGLFDIFRNQQRQGVDVRIVVWEPALHTPDTIPDPSPATIPGVNQGPGSIQARWDTAKGYHGWYQSPHGHFEPFPLMFPADLGCHHQKTYIMDDGAGGVVAFVGGINPVQAYWDTQAHDSLDARRVAKGKDPLQGLEQTPPLHDIFYKITGPAVGDILANFIQRYNGASISHADVTTDAVASVTAEQIPQVPDGIELQVLRTIAPDTYPGTERGDRGIREFYLNALGAAGAGDLIYIEDQYFFDHGIISEIHEAALRGAKVLALLTSKPDEGTMAGKVESMLESMGSYSLASPLVEGQDNVALLTLGNSRPDPRQEGKVINSETYIHSKTMVVLGADWALMTGGSANIAFTSMWFHSEMNIAFTDVGRIKSWMAQLWAEHLQISVDDARALLGKPDDAFTVFKEQAVRNKAAMEGGTMPEGRVYFWKDIVFPPRQLEGAV
ncbi:MAG: phosphatidylserine/phosphatidylglycerophosphate/cardiolipin synthase family protein [Desulfocapsaceae bacterium]|nr:phosphatidylserine/phosphatidylglycerophosphate/cardiolipin synthase family protein [Desulfocapsaceae bacterium]